MKKTLSRSLPLLLALGLLAGCGNNEVPLGSEMTGSGTKNDPYKIASEEQLNDFREKYSDDEHSGAFFELTRDINLTSEWEPLGSLEKPFSGQFNGNGHTISGILLKTLNDDYYGGFFAHTDSAYIHDVKLSMSLDITIAQAIDEACVGGLVGYANNSVIDNCSVNFTKYKLVSKQPSGADGFFAGGLVGYLGYKSDDGIMSGYLTGNDIKGNIRITCDKFTTSSVGGLVGYVYTGYGDGICGIANNKYEGIVEGGIYTGGILGTCTSYVSLVNNLVVSTSISTYGNSYSYAGGIAGMTVSECALVNNYAGVDAITANPSQETYKSFSGDIVGYAVRDSYDELYDEMGTLNTGNYAKGATLKGDNKVRSNNVSAISSELLTTLGFNEKAWNYATYTPKSVDNYSSTITISSNGGEEDDKTFVVNFKNGLLETLTIERTYYNFKDGHSFYGITFDDTPNTMWRWYTPVTSDITLKASFADISGLKGTYNVSYVWYEKSSSAGCWSFDENYFYWTHDDGACCQYEYSFNGNYIFIGEYLGEYAEAHGGYANTIFAYDKNERVINCYDVESDDCYYTGVFAYSNVTSVDYSGEAFLGEWYNEKVWVDLVSSGIAASRFANPSESQVKWFGGFKGDKDSLRIYVGGRVNETVKYDAENELLIGKNTVFCRENGIKTYSTDSGDVKVTLIGEKTLVILQNVVTDKTVTGDITTDKEVIIDGVTYQVNGYVLSSGDDSNDSHEQGGDSSQNQNDDSSFVGTYICKSQAGNNTLVINADGTGTYNGVAITYTVEGNTLSFYFGGELYTITKSGNSYSGTFEYDCEEYIFISVTRQ